MDERGVGKRGFEGYGYLYKDFEESRECNIMHDRIHQVEMGGRPWNSAMGNSDEAERPRSSLAAIRLRLPTLTKLQLEK